MEAVTRHGGQSLRLLESTLERVAPPSGEAAVSLLADTLKRELQRILQAGKTPSNVTEGASDANRFYMSKPGPWLPLIPIHASSPLDYSAAGVALLNTS
jgi:hypothetical protein